jgi:hypothetical protein
MILPILTWKAELLLILKPSLAGPKSKGRTLSFWS